MYVWCPLHISDCPDGGGIGTKNSLWFGCCLVPGRKSRRVWCSSCAVCSYVMFGICAITHTHTHRITNFSHVVPYLHVIMFHVHADTLLRHNQSTIFYGYNLQLCVLKPSQNQSGTLSMSNLVGKLAMSSLYKIILVFPFYSCQNIGGITSRKWSHDLIKSVLAVMKVNKWQSVSKSLPDGVAELPH